MAVKRSLLLRAIMIFDLIVMLLAFTLATWGIYQYSGNTELFSFDSFLSMRVKISNFLLMIAFLYCWHLIFLYKGLYQSHRLSTELTVALDIAVATLLGSILLFLSSVLFDIALVTPIFLVLFWIVSTSILIVCRLVLRSMLQRIRLLGRNLRHFVVLGTNDRACKYVDMISAMPELGYRFVGYVDGSNDETRPDKGMSIITDYDHFPAFLRETVVDEIVVFSPMRSHYDQIARIVAVAEEQGIIVRFGIDPFALKIGRSVAARVGNVTVSTIQTGGMYDKPSLRVKTVLDVLLSGIALIVLSPLLLITALLIKWQSPGPVLFIQQRMGLNKRLFNIYKFRTMTEDAEQQQAELEKMNEADGPVFKIKDDPRITSIGKWLRKTSIDELPQLFNVIIGDMSLVGPRPLPVRDFNGFETDIHRRRFSVKPGITCLWQISGRSNISFEQWMEMDMSYIDKWSLWLDLKILVMTIPAVLSRTGAE